MSTEVADPTVAQPPRKKGRKLVLAIVCVVCIGAGAAVPMFVNVQSIFGKPKAEPKSKGADQASLVIVTFGDVTVNLAEERMNRYLRMKVAFLVEPEAEGEVTDLVAKQKAALKSAMIAHIAGKSLKDVSGAVGINRLQRELLERVEDVLYPEGHSHIRSVLFEDYIIQ